MFENATFSEVCQEAQRLKCEIIFSPTIFGATQIHIRPWEKKAEPKKHKKKGKKK